ncbi:hypothetical protein J2Z79_002932 [Symbiobacterium terraclitae]|uniref:Uncharacterized protein n=1 Tax=Symbiobacterium terraclitae TaxID=557451 RepID=A0ABS4JVC6_9FIRM|nr:hypothetical protein [Symbiobacterium terraclitae]
MPAHRPSGQESSCCKDVRTPEAGRRAPQVFWHCKTVDCDVAGSVGTVKARSAGRRLTAPWLPVTGDEPPGVLVPLPVAPRVAGRGVGGIVSACAGSRPWGVPRGTSVRWPNPRLSSQPRRRRAPPILATAAAVRIRELVPGALPFMAPSSSSTWNTLPASLALVGRWLVSVPRGTAQPHCFFSKPLRFWPWSCPSQGPLRGRHPGGRRDSAPVPADPTVTHGRCAFASAWDGHHFAPADTTWNTEHHGWQCPAQRCEAPLEGGSRPRGRYGYLRTCDPLFHVEHADGRPLSTLGRWPGGARGLASAVVTSVVDLPFPRLFLVDCSTWNTRELFGWQGITRVSQPSRADVAPSPTRVADGFPWGS